MAVKGYDDEAVVLGERIKYEITKAGMKQADLAKTLGLSPSRLSNYINGIRLPDFFTLCRMADALKISVEDFSPECRKRQDETAYILKISGKCSVSLERVG